MSKRLLTPLVCLALVGGSAAGAWAEAAAVPATPSRTDVAAGMKLVRASVLACRLRHEGVGTVKVQLEIAPAGTVTGAVAKSSPDKKLGECVARAVAGATFAASQKGLSVSYPFQFTKELELASLEAMEIAELAVTLMEVLADLTVAAEKDCKKMAAGWGAAIKRHRALIDRMKALDASQTKEEQKALEARFKPRLDAVMSRMMKGMMECQADEAMAEVMRQF